MYVFTPNTLIKSAEVNANFTESVSKLYNLNPYIFSAYLGSDQALSAVTWTKLNINTESYDVNSNFSTSTYGYTVPVTGYYTFTVTALLFAQAGATFLIGISKNGTTEYARLGEIPNTTGNCTHSGSIDIYLTSGEVIYAMAYSGAAKTVYSTNQYTRFSGRLITV